MECVKCKASFGPTEALTPTYTQAFVTVLKDWRLWVFAFLLTFVSGAVAGALGFKYTGFAGGIGAALAIFVFLRTRTVRKCPKCAAVFQASPQLEGSGSKT